MEQKDIDAMIATLRQQRDELKVKAALGKADLRDEWQGLESKWATLEARIASAAKEADRSSPDVKAALSLLGEELKAAYERMRRHFG